MNNLTSEIQEEYFDCVVNVEMLTEEHEESRVGVAQSLISAKIRIGKKYIDITNRLTDEEIELIIDHV